MNENVKYICENIKAARKYKGYTQKQAASLLGITQQQYSRYENGKFELNYSFILKICELYEITPNDIFNKP